MIPTPRTAPADSRLFGIADRRETRVIKIAERRCTSGPIAVANLSSAIDKLEPRSSEGPTFEDLEALSNLLFLRGDLLGRIADHDRAERVADLAVALSPDTARALHMRARLAVRFHRFEEAHELLDRALAAGCSAPKIDTARAALFQATGKYDEALRLREDLANADWGIHTLGALATLLAEMQQWPAANHWYAAALHADDGVSPLRYGQLLFEWGVSAMRRGNLKRAEELFMELDAVLPAHVPGRGHRAEAALARGRLDVAGALIAPLLDTSDDPKYRAIHAEILDARRDHEAAEREAEHAAARYELLLARRPEVYAENAAVFFMGIGNRPQLAADLATANWKRRDTPRSRGLLLRALRNAEQVSRVQAPADRSWREKVA